MIVADASAIVELLLARPLAERVRGALHDHTELHAPEHLHVECLSALRRYALRGELSESRGAVALDALAELRVLRYPVIEIRTGVWDLRHALTAHDAAYLALARRLDCLLLTIDSGLASVARSEGRLAELRPVRSRRRRPR